MNLNEHHKTSVADRIPMGQKVAYGLGGIVPIALANIVYMLMGIIGNISLGLSALVLGLVMAVPRLWDAFTDPMMGYISDNTRSSAGRRRPYVLWGGIAVCIAFVLLWWIPKGEGASAWVQFGYILLLLIMFYTAVTVFEIPHGALGMEMTADYHERTRLFAAKSFIGNMGAMATPWLYGLAQLDLFKGAGGNASDGMRYVSLIVAIIVLPCIIICYKVCREGKLEQVKEQERVPFRENIGVTFRNKTFLLLVAIIFMVIMGFNFVGNFANYITIFYLYGGDQVSAAKLMGVTGTVWAVTSLVAIPPMNWISARVGKTLTMLVSISLMAGGQLTKIWCYNPEHPYLILIPTAMLSAGMVMYFTLASAMVADVCDEDELHTGNRNEGAYYSIFWWFMKLGMAFAGIVAGALLLVSDFDDKQSSMVDAVSGPVRELKAGFEKDAEMPSAADVTEKISISIKQNQALADHFRAMQEKVPSDAEHYAELLEGVERIDAGLQSIYTGAEEFTKVCDSVLSKALEVSRQSVRTVNHLRIFEIGIPILLSVMSFIAMRLYPLSEKRVYEIKAELDRRKETASND
ncbi:MFS transporter [Pontiella desulfatans]|nr:MFS transporter [Pontiella desulfatans]